MITMLILVILLLLFIIVMQRKLKYPANYPPGPFPWPFIGNMYYFKKLCKKLGGQHLAFSELSKQYNSNVISLRLGDSDTIIVSNSKSIYKVLSQTEYDGRPWNEFIKIRNMGMRSGITMNDGPEWKKLRSWTVYALKNAGFAQKQIMELLLNELELILKKLKKGGVQDIQTIIAPTIINVLWILIAGKRFSQDQRLQNFLNLMQRRSVIFDMFGGVLSIFPWLRFVFPEKSGYSLLVKINNELKSLLMEAINEHKERFIEGKKEDFIDMFLHEMLTQKDKNTVFSDENLIVTLIDLFIAGTKTTTATLEVLFLQMANHQDVQRKLQEEIDIIIGSRFPHIEDKIKMPFTEAVLMETQRRYLVAPVIGPRRVLDDTTLEGYTIPKNSTVLINIHSISMDEELFPDPESFKPERHLDENGACRKVENFTPFGKGKRRCPGEALAKSALFLLLVGVLQKYNLLPVPGEKSITAEFTSGLIISPKPYKMLIVPR
ncbi:probable cytochrome P450 305a1 [Nylanderia fulva]|uniref:probable cytochrome P450 305a1 n=1 Tax=Nylanderia fulva TaxID=613905 RepID=UPI0010FBAB1B|nr:probable cytochrome P450 305a1 [Nylanderia fulva]XP_029161084.1 probable cytochrome P450 305a1 [Nylanderia fulva]XP_029161085.1 probable cytochrome P450 305a1 [Nylanderia fulva]XP_029161086.1 probable cytochrome P450 305a1 [Nylanderia fulva]